MNGVSPEIFAQTQERIEKIEQEKDVKILLAVES
jgi:ABC-type branched-subunit amino acid transport system ATPase component